MRLMITGGTGFVGRAAVREAIGRGATVGLLAREDGPHLTAHDAFVLGPGPWDRAAIEKAMTHFVPDAVLHLAGGPSAASTEALYEINLFLGLRLLEAVRTTGPTAKIVVVGSAAEYGLPSREDGMVCEDDPAHPIHPYGIAKLSQTLHALSIALAGQSIVVARLFNPVGPGMPSGLVFSDVARQIARGATRLRTGDIDTARDFMPVEEAARILIDLVDHPQASGIVNVCSGRSQVIRRAVERMIAAARRPVDLTVDERLGRRGGVRSIYGHTGRLRALEIEPASSNIDDALHRLLETYA